MLPVVQCQSRHAQLLSHRLRASLPHAQRDDRGLLYRGGKLPGCSDDTRARLRMQLADPVVKQPLRGVTQSPDGCCEAATVVQIVLNRSLLLRLGVPRSASVAGRQVMALLKLPMPALEGVLRWVADGEWSSELVYPA